jgi:enoyl-CoA hydratase
MTEIVRYELQGTVATITLDDGRANAMSPTMQRAINDALDKAETDKAAVVLAGRKRIFSAGFDLEILKNFNDETVTMLRGGFELAVRLMSFPAPVIIACTGHAMAMGSFLLCAADYRIGSAGEFKIGANEVAIGLTMPTPALAMIRHRLSPTAVTRSVVLAEIFDPAAAVGVGFLDQVVEAEDVVAEAQSFAARVAPLDRAAYLGSKLRLHSATIDAVLAGIETEYPRRA